jgi:outer membrane protein assembly factor BamB
MNRGYLYIFSSGRIAKIKKQDGEVVWATKLEVRGLKSSSVANVQLDGDRIYIGASGVLACVKESDGSLIWSNPLKGWGFGYVIFANQQQTDAEAAIVAANTAAGV